MTTQAQTAQETGIQTIDPVMDTALAQVRAEEARFALAQRRAQVYAQSTLVPKEYHGNIGNVLIAENMAHRMGADTLMVMQNLYIVHGRPGWSSQFLIATFNSNGRFSAIKYRFKGEQGNDDWGCQAYCIEHSTGEEISGTWITWGMATSEGWTIKNGSKWRTMPEQMFRYRSAAFLIRATAPEIGLGLLTKEELEDVNGGNGNGNGSQVSGVGGLKDRLQIPSAQPAVDGELVTTIDAEPVFDEPSTEQPKAESGLEQPVEASTTSAAPSKEIDPEESRKADLVIQARELHQELKAKPRRQADEWLGQRMIPDLTIPELEEYLDTFAPMID